MPAPFKITKLPPIELLQALLELDEETGEIKDRVKRGSVSWPGRVNSCTYRDGSGTRYGLVAIRKKQYKAHRIAWALKHGRDPWPEIVDHINGDTLDNRPCNLRIASPFQNAQNAKPRNPASGIQGVQWKPASKKWAARISINGKLTHIGLFSSPEEASAAYEEMRRKHHGEFVRAA